MYHKLSTSLLAEFIGTFALIFIGAGAGALGIGGLVGVAFAHGLVVLGFAYAYGHISGTHINPAVTLGVWAAGKIDAAPRRLLHRLPDPRRHPRRARPALGARRHGTGLGVTALAHDLAGEAATTITITPVIGVVLEAILTFFLVNAVMNAGISGKATIPGGLAIGLTLTFCILMGGPLTGASLNPARSIGPAVATGNFADLWVYLVGPIARRRHRRPALQDGLRGAGAGLGHGRSRWARMGAARPRRRPIGLSPAFGSTSGHHPARHVQGPGAGLLDVQLAAASGCRRRGGSRSRPRRCGRCSGSGGAEGHGRSGRRSRRRRRPASAVIIRGARRGGRGRPARGPPAGRRRGRGSAPATS